MMTTLTQDDYKVRVLDALKVMQRGVSRDKWFKTTAIVETSGCGHYQVVAALRAMASEGWLHIRHNEERPEQLLYRLRQEYE